MPDLRRYGIEMKREDITTEFISGLSKEFMEKEPWFYREFEALHGAIRDNESLGYLNFLRIRNYKLQLRTEATEEEVANNTQDSFKAKDVRGSISPLLELHGVSLPTASTILAMRDPNKFAIIDVNTLTAIRELYDVDWVPINKKNDNEKNDIVMPQGNDKGIRKRQLKLYEKYLNFLTDLSNELGVELLDIERSLFIIGRDM